MFMICIRHGESQFNVEGRIQGQLDPPLSPLGLRQANALAAALATERIELVVASPLRRAWDTARPLAEACGCPLVADERLLELNAGIFQGLLASELSTLHPREAASWQSADPDFRIPGGESRRDLMLRGAEALRERHAAGHSRVAIVAHGGILSGAFKALLEIPAQRNPFTLWNASRSVLAWENAAAATYPKLVTLNDVEHLRRVNCPLSSRTGEL